MNVNPAESKAKFHIGQLVEHLRFGYRGVVIDVDPVFQASEQWYARVARSKPPKDQPWYHVLVDGAAQRTYVAERHLQADCYLSPIRHPQLDSYFQAFDNGHYIQKIRAN